MNMTKKKIGEDIMILTLILLSIILEALSPTYTFLFIPAFVTYILAIYGIIIKWGLLKYE